MLYVFLNFLNLIEVHSFDQETKKVCNQDNHEVSAVDLRTLVDITPDHGPINQRYQHCNEEAEVDGGYQIKRAINTQLM